MMLYQCYISKLGSDCNLGKDLSKREENSQLIKHKNIGLYLLSIDHEESKRYPYLYNEEIVRRT